MNFFFDNPFITIILIAVISSFFKKKKENSGQKQSRPKQPGQGQQRPLNPFEEARDLFKELARPVSQETRPIPGKTVEKEARLKRRADTAAGSFVRAQPQSIDLKEAVPEMKMTVNTDTVPTPEKTPKRKLEIQEDHIIDAVIWSEILGPPRAKNPYMRKNFRS